MITIGVGGDATTASIQTQVTAFRTALGGANNGVGGSFASGRREINWDVVPAGFSEPNALPGNFFNANSPRRLQMTPDSGTLQVTTGAGDFAPFSGTKLFGLTGTGTAIDVTFFVPGTATQATSG